MNIVKEISILPYIFISMAIVFSIRLFPFIVFKDEASVPPSVKYIGKYLPPAIVAGIVIYCLKGIDFTIFPFGLWEIIAIAVVALLHLWKKNMLISVFAGTIIYMFLVQSFTVQAAVLTTHSSPTAASFPLSSLASSGTAILSIFA